MVVTAAAGWAGPLPVQTFDADHATQHSEVDYGTWNPFSDDASQGCSGQLERVSDREGAGQAFRIAYDVDSPNPAYCGFWAKLSGVDLRPYHNLVLWVKGDRRVHYTTQVKLELKQRVPPPLPNVSTAPGLVVGRYLLKGITDEWQRLVVPLDAFEGLPDRSDVMEFVIVFDDINATKKVGAISIDDIAFE